MSRPHSKVNRYRIRCLVIEPVPDYLRRGRLVFEGEHISDGRKVLEFGVPSGSRCKRLYWIPYDVETRECHCGCEDYRARRGSDEARHKWGTDEEKELGLQVQITRRPLGLCKHLRKVRDWLKRRGWELAKEVENNGDAQAA